MPRRGRRFAQNRRLEHFVRNFITRCGRRADRAPSDEWASVLQCDILTENVAFGQAVAILDSKP
jgi:hypothetical protein